MTSPFISIIIPSFNAGKTIRQTLSSISSQTYSSFEALIIDGVSTDETRDIAEAFCLTDSRIILFSDKDKGIYDAMNKGIEKARGKWLLFLGADDKLSDQGILGRMAENMADSNAEMVYGNVRICGNSDPLKDGDIYDGAFSIEKLFKKNISHQAIFYARSAFYKIGVYDIRYPICADWDLNHRCFANLRVQYVDEIVSDFSVAGVSAGRWDQFSVDSVVNLKQYYGFSYFNPFFKPYSWAFYHQANKLAREGAFLRAFYFAVFSFVHSNELLQLSKSYLKNMMSWISGGNSTLKNS